MLIVHLVVNVKDAMGANSINSMAEGIAPRLEQLSGTEAHRHVNLTVPAPVFEP
jgi:hydroxymethylglutaryl-CoA reductase